jgi:hypothetical protein
LIGTRKVEDEVFSVESWLNYHGKVLSERFQLEALQNDESSLKNHRYYQGQTEFY